MIISQELPGFFFAHSAKCNSISFVFHHFSKPVHIYIFHDNLKITKLKHWLIIA